MEGIWRANSDMTLIVIQDMCFDWTDEAKDDKVRIRVRNNIMYLI